MTVAHRSDFDPVTLEILWSRLISTVDEAAVALVRTSFSTIVRESNDFGISALMAAGLTLFVMTLLVNAAASAIVARSRSGSATEI